MSGWWVVAVSVALAGAAAGILMRSSIREVWDAILALVLFIPIYACCGDNLSDWAEEWLARNGAGAAAPIAPVLAGAGLAALGLFVLCSLAVLAVRQGTRLGRGR